MSSTNLTETPALIEQHIHGGFGIDFANTDTDGFIEFAKKITKHGVCAFYPTLATDTVDNLKRQISRIKEAIYSQPQGSAKILGVNLESCFINPEKKGIHDESQLLKPTVSNYKLLEDEIIKIVTVAPELDEGYELCSYLELKGVKVSAGHCLATDLSAVSQVTHLYNAMGEFSHRVPSTTVSALHDDRITVELIADFMHVRKDVLDLTFRIKPNDKIILISDALPIAHSAPDSMTFCNRTVYIKDGKATDANGTLAGSIMFLDEIIKQLVQNNILDFPTAVKMASTNIMQTNAKAYWDEDLNISHIEF